MILNDDSEVIMLASKLRGILRRTLAFVGLNLFVSSAAIANLWEAADTPYASQASAIGSYANGCLKGAEALPLNGNGYQVIRPQRQRYYGHPELIEFIEQYSASLNRLGSDDILIADMSMPRGGNFTQGHTSHQIGLDVDIWLKLAAEPLLDGEREQPTPLKLVNQKQFKLDTQLWSNAQTQMLKLAAIDARVARIFVSPVIKQHLCDLGLDDDAWLEKVRPWWGHTYHMHVRLRCPKGDEFCREQVKIPKGSGCSELGWWRQQLTQAKVAKVEKPKVKPKQVKAKRKPKLCEAVVTAK
ncbi:penicillin-insensitive murein endopeptidase [Shewanella schlegeliana]|uniref:Penicillin-insensitive murein endopeptidase n=1 Tax=Shewanella schlegeliana TaxID=190308 RepID=A0ABS1T2A3_9GAMM|nr:penicillin-insensitive murein endopeptidase [Shewanella schlegeliana]MBL4914921.1 penicillin-insensitive murein endopeptidase [Shewanella schlegeliana]MCL1110388.1 penicillin-insensitive murein endopeptidase [Shewanella schlegeliana]GIU27888.1 penicillin-insensitive murein endopeptidase [Shewanella schlegeliana]